MSNTAVEYYNRKFGDDKSGAFIHLVREIGEIAFAMEKNNLEHAKMEITESAALLHYLASKYGFDLDTSMETLYLKKLTASRQAPPQPSSSSSSSSSSPSSS
ncbi:MAG TPA: hypothetical protein VJP79_11845 [Nitrososphaera sp.]|nr:hypothetical protein [Nitrososphaera sp.]